MAYVSSIMNDINHTTLTPGFTSLNFGSSNHSENDSISQMRQAAQKLIQEGDGASASILLRYLVSNKNSCDEDVILLAKAYFLTNDYRRCLTTIEQRNMLSINESSTLLKWIEQHCVESISGPESSESILQRLSLFVMAGECLYLLEKYEDCVNFLEPFLDIESIYTNNPFNSLTSLKSSPFTVNPISSIFNLVGKCLDMLENRQDSIRFLSLAIKIDPCAVQSLEYIITRRLLSTKAKHDLFHQLPILNGTLQYLDQYYRSSLLETEDDDQSTSTGPLSSYSLVVGAEKAFEQHKYDVAYKLSQKAYNLDQSDTRGLAIYISSAVELNLTSELYYLGHELTSISPKSALSWFAVGCYYFCCKKYELAQKYLSKTTKLDKRFAGAWIALGQCFSRQQESEHAIAAIRCAVRLCPGDYRPFLYMARELVKMNNFHSALHLLLNAHQLESRDIQILNELGVILVKLERVDESLQYFHEASLLCQDKLLDNSSCLSSKLNSGLIEIFSNYGVALRKTGNYLKSYQYYEMALSLNPQDADLHLNIGFLLHLMRRFDEAIEHYHISLALKPHSSISLELIQRAILDLETYSPQI